VTRRHGAARVGGDDAVTPGCLGWYVAQFCAPVFSSLGDHRLEPEISGTSP